MKRDERNFVPKKVSRPSNPPDELAQNVSKKKNLSDSCIFSSKVQNLSVFFNHLHDSNSIFLGRRELIQRTFHAARCSKDAQWLLQVNKVSCRWLRPRLLIGFLGATRWSSPLQFVCAPCVFFFANFRWQTGVRLRYDLLLHDLVDNTDCMPRHLTL